MVYFAVMFFGHLPDHLILFPTRTPINASGAVRKTIPFKDGQLELWIAQSQAAQSKGHADMYVLHFYGNADRAERWPAAEAEMWNDRAVEIWGMNYPGFGGSTGPAWLSKIVPARYHRLVVDAYAGEKRVISLRSAYHNDPIEGTALADLNDALSWLLTKAGSHRAPH